MRETVIYSNTTVSTTDYRLTINDHDATRVIIGKDQIEVDIRREYTANDYESLYYNIKHYIYNKVSPKDLEFIKFIFMQENIKAIRFLRC